MTKARSDQTDLPTSTSQKEASKQGLSAGSEAADLSIRRLPERGMSCNSYYLSLGDDHILIDPSQDLPEDLSQPSALLCTHGHYDHIAAVDRLRSVDVQVFVARPDAPFLTTPSLNLGPLFGQEGLFLPADRKVTDGEVLTFDSGLTFEWRLTPGHTPGSACLLLSLAGLPRALFTGDTLFCDSIGRTDFPGGDARQMSASLQQLKSWLTQLPPDLSLYPGHGPVTTVGRELQHNLFLQKV